MQNTRTKGCGSIMSEEENNVVGGVDAVMSSEESSSYPDDESELELGLGLSLGGGGGKGRMNSKPPGSWNHYARILTAEDFTSVVVSNRKEASSSSSSSSVTKANDNGNCNNVNGSCGTKRTAAEPSSPPGRSQVVGWPPVRTYRMNSLSNQTKSLVTEEFFSTVDECKNETIDKTDNAVNKNNHITKEKGLPKKSLFVKVNMDGSAIGRKVDLNAHSCYKTLARALDDMFRNRVAVGSMRSNMDKQGTIQPERLLDGSSDFVLTYEDKDGDWMLVGDVPWEMFLSSVRRLRIMRTNEANGLGPNSNQRNYRQLTAPI